MPKAWKILFLKPGLLGLASCWCWLLPVADCPSFSALCTNELFACIRLCSHAYVSGRRWDSIRIRSGCAGRDERRGGTKKRTKRKKKRIVDDYKCSCQLLHGMRMCVLLICTLRWRTEERKKKEDSPPRGSARARCWLNLTASRVWWNSSHHPAVAPLAPCLPAPTPIKR